LLVAVSGIAAIVIGQVFNPDSLVVILIIVLVIGGFGFVGALLVIRLPANPIGWLLWVTGTGLGWAIAGVAYGTGSVATCGGCLPVTAPIALTANVAFAPILGAVAVFLPLLFPDGRLASPRWRPVAWLGVIAIVLFTASLAFSPGPISGGIAIENPIGIDGFGGSLADPNTEPGPFSTLAITLLVLAMVLALVSVIWRYRHAGPIQRQQLRWFGYAGLLMIGAVLVGVKAPWDWSWIVMVAGLGLLPLAIGIAMLRYRLYELDRLVSRTIAYAVVTGLLVATYAGLVLLLEGPLGSAAGGETIPVALSTLAVATLFTPVRRRVQRIVDRRFDRARYDAKGTTTAFSERLRNETDLGAVTTALDGTVRRAMAPTVMQVWLREGQR
jgi:hypothetical protein